MLPGTERFTVEDLVELSELVAGSWSAGADHESLAVATRVLAGLVATADDDVRVAMFRHPSVLLGDRDDAGPRAAFELALHGHDVASSLGVPFEPPYALCFRLREHTRHWPLWTVGWDGLADTGDPWTDLLQSTGRLRAAH